MKKTLEFTISKGTDKNGKTYYYLENADLCKRVFLTEQEVKLAKLLKLID